MALVVSQTIPFDDATLDLENNTRWGRLIPLIRPSVVSIPLRTGGDILVDVSFAPSRKIQIVGVGPAELLSSNFIARKDTCAFVLTSAGSQKAPSVKEIGETLINHGFDLQWGLVIISAGNKNESWQEDQLPYHMIELKENHLVAHLLALCASATFQILASTKETSKLVLDFFRNTKSISSIFKEHKSEFLAVVKTEEATVPFESAKKTIQKNVISLVDSEKGPNDKFTFSVHLTEINGLSKLENLIIVHEISKIFDDRKLGLFLTSSSLNDKTNRARGWVISASPVSSEFLSPQPKPLPVPTDDSSSTPLKFLQENDSIIKLTDTEVRRRIIQGCKTVIQAEPTITEYDTIVGDGDCGFTLRDGANQVLSFIKDRDLSLLPTTISALVDDLEVNMGGTSGALYCIFLSAFAQSLSTAETLPEALGVAQNHLLKYTRARLGDRTMLDCLIPFVDTWKSTGNVIQALDAATKGVDGTKKLEAKLGRSTYLDESTTQGVPDPGAYGLLKLLEGMVRNK